MARFRSHKVRNVSLRSLAMMDVVRFPTVPSTAALSRGASMRAGISAGMVMFSHFLVGSIQDGGRRTSSSL